MTRTFFLFFLLLGSYELFAQCPEGFITSQTNLVNNGDFSKGNEDFSSDYLYTIEHSEGNIMMAEGYYSVVDNPTYIHRFFAGCKDHTAPSGKLMAVNGASLPNQAVWKQTIKVKPQTSYYFSTWISNLVPDAPSKLEFAINGKALGDPIVASATTCEWKQFFAVWNSGESMEAEISIVNQNLTAYGNDFALDDIVFYTCESTDLQSQLNHAKVGTTIALRNIFFDTGKSILKTESLEQLHVLLNFMNTHKNATIEIDGHTDNVGTAEDNIILSKQRAKAVYDFLVKNNIEKNRLKYQGWGEQKPIDSNETIEGRQKNRRVEFIILTM